MTKGPTTKGPTTRPSTSVEVVLPVRRYGAVGAWGRLVGRMALVAGQHGAVVRLVVAVVPEPVLPRLEAGDQRVTGLLPVRGGVLGGRGVAAADVPALGAPSQVEPPPPGVETLHTAGTRRCDGRVDPLGAHPPT